ncbi:hypothetical protein [Halobacterium sp. R2-5]|uniref:DUF7344 domain-containing protein n=1 Tax=Halobacterium sp. R2-5 TaxID=2715751 RepID=UPI00141DC33D|nr:hypothetical protein [Halobacterium sp. R2-5]NIB98520.1 hypothetical protein [Halobacterium sp. R2-5]
MSQSDTPESLTQDTVYDLLSNARRRFVLSYLRDRSEPIELSELSREVAAWENDTPVEDLTSQQIKRVYVSLYQTHIPKLDESGLVDYDSDSGDVELTENVDVLDTYLPEREQQETPWQLVYASIAAAGLLVYGAILLFPATFAFVPMTALNVVVITVFAVVTAAHYYAKSRR